MGPEDTRRDTIHRSFVCLPALSCTCHEKEGLEDDKADVDLVLGLKHEEVVDLATSAYGAYIQRVPLAVN